MDCYSHQAEVNKAKEYAALFITLNVQKIAMITRLLNEPNDYSFRKWLPSSLD